MIFSPQSTYVQPTLPPLAQSAVMIVPQNVPVYFPTSEPEVQAPPKKVNCWVWLCAVLYLLSISVLAFFLVFAHRGNLKPENELGILTRLSDNLKQIPIQDVKVSTGFSATRRILLQLKNGQQRHLDPTCDAGYDPVTLGYFEGVKAGCLCSDGTIHSSSYCLSKSSSDCANVQSTNSVPIKKWKGQLVCVKRVENFKWVGTSSCPSGSKLCQAGVCVKDIGDDSCPLSNFKVDAAGTLKFDNVNKFKVDRGTKLQPFVSVDLSPSSAKGPCFSTVNTPKTDGNQAYPLYKRPGTDCVQMKKYSKQVDKFTTQLVYKQNGIETTVNDVPFWGVFNNKNTDQLGLNFIRRIKINTDKVCDDVNPAKITQLTHKVDSIHTFGEVFSITLLSISLFTLFLALVLFLYRQNPKVEQFNQTKTWALIAALVAVSFLVSAIVYICIVEKKDGISQIGQQFHKFAQKKCFHDKVISEAVKKAAKYAKDTYVNNFTVLIIGMVLSGLLLIILPLLVKYELNQGVSTACLDPWKVV